MASDFEFYKLMVEEAREARAARRSLANTFMTMNLAGVGALGFLAKGEAEALPGVLLIWCAAALMLVCAIWWVSNTYYTRILTAKFKVIGALEEAMNRRPLADEWAVITGQGRGIRWFTLERAMPFLFLIGYLVFLVYATNAEEILGDVQRMIGSVTAQFQR